MHKLLSPQGALRIAAALCLTAFAAACKSDSGNNVP